MAGSKDSAVAAPPAKAGSKEAMAEAMIALDTMTDAAEVDKMEAERRAIRKNQSALKDKFKTNKDDVLDIQNKAWNEIRTANNETKQGILYTREALGDVRILADLSKSLHTKAIRLDDNSKRINFKDFVIRIKALFKGKQYGEAEEEYEEPEDDEEAAASKRKRRGGVIRDNSGGASEFDWCTLGADVGALFTTPFPATMMLGPLGKPPKVRVVKERQAPARKDNSKVITAEEVVQDSDDDEEEEIGEDGKPKEKKEFNEATFARINNQVEVLSDLKKTGRSHLQLVPFLVDTDDQVQTVENFFDYAFLIKEKATKQKLDKSTGLPVIQTAEREQLEEKESRQLVLSLNMRELKELAKLVKEEEGLESDDEESNDNGNGKSSSSSSKKRRRVTLHRDHVLYQTDSVHDQADLILEMEARSKERAKARRKERQAAEKEENKKIKAQKKASPKGGASSSSKGKKRDAD